MSESEQAEDNQEALTVTEGQLLDDLAEQIVVRRLGTVAILFLETMRPLGFVASQVLLFFRPLVQIMFSDPTRYQTLQQALERRGTVELLIKRIERRM